MITRGLAEIDVQAVQRLAAPAQVQTQLPGPNIGLCEDVLACIANTSIIIWMGGLRWIALVLGC